MLYHFALQIFLSIFTVIVLPFFQIEIKYMHFPCIPSFVRQSVFVTHLKQNKYHIKLEANTSKACVCFVCKIIGCTTEIFVREKKVNVIHANAYTCAVLLSYDAYRSFFLKERRFPKIKQRFNVDI